MAHKNIPIFIPHLGCPNMCVFCNQRSISGKTSFNRESVTGIIEEALKTIDPEKDDAEIAFFGGSFTGIDRDDMLYLLKIAKEYIDKGKIGSVRLSTRPDYINEEILTILKNHGVKTIELGIQSLSDKVLSASKRGHSSDDSKKACMLIKEYGFSLVGQMMLGLPSSNLEDELMTAEVLCKLRVDTVRIYPTAVFSNTELECMRLSGEYTPLSVNEGAERAAKILMLIESYKIPCIRCGLQAQENLSDSTVLTAGAYHPAFGSISLGKVMKLSVLEELHKHDIPPQVRPRQVRFAVSPKRLFDAYGYKKENKVFFLENYNIHVKFIADSSVHGYECKLLEDTK